MILVTVGSSDFNRVVMLVDELKGRGEIKDKLIIQTGMITYRPRNADETFNFTSWERINQLNKEAVCVISHAGAGCILTALQYGTPFIAVPRKKDLGEHVNDHQLEISQTLEKHGKVLVANDGKEIMECIKKVNKGWKPKSKNNKSDIVAEITSYIESIS